MHLRFLSSNWVKIVFSSNKEQKKYTNTHKFNLMFYIQNSFSSIIIIYTLCHVRVALLKYYSIFTKKHMLCLPDGLDGLEKAAVAVFAFAKQNQRQVEKAKEFYPHLI